MNFHSPVVIVSEIHTRPCKSQDSRSHHGEAGICFNSTRIRSHDAPATAPAPMSTVFQIRLPAVVRRRNGSSSIFAIPAGIEIRLRMIGTNRQKRRLTVPFSPAIRLHLSHLPLLLPAVSPCPAQKCIKLLHGICRPSSYRISAPSTEPAVAARTAPAMFIRVYVVINPPKVKITSDGIGGNKFSIRIRQTFPHIRMNLKVPALYHA